MKTHQLIVRRSSVYLAGALLLAAVQGAGAASWIGSTSVADVWSNPANWDTGIIPGAADPVAFSGIGGYTNVQGAVNNVVDQNFTINDLSFSSLTPNYYGSSISAGTVLKISGQGVINNLVVNNSAGSLGANDQVYATVTGQGGLVVSNPQGSVIVRQYSTSSGSHRATLDLSGLNTFTGAVTNVLAAVGTAAAETRPAGTILLARTNYITTGTDTTKPGILLAKQTTTDSGATASLTLGTWNEINTEGLVVSGHRANSGATMSFPAGTTGNSLKVRGSSGGSSRATLVSAGDNTATEANYTGGTATSQSTSGTMNLLGGSVDILANDLVLGRNASPSSTGTGNTGTGTGTLTYEQGVIDVNNLYLGYKVGANYGNAVGTLNLNGAAQMTVNNNVSMASRAANGTALPSATINIASGATLSVKGDITDPGTGNSTINVNGGTINMQPAGDAVPGNITIDNLNGTGTISGAGTVAIGTNLTLGTAVTAGTLNLGGNLVLSNGLVLSFNLGNATTTGGGVNDYLNLSGNLTLNGNTLQLVPLAPLATGTYRLSDYTGARTGSFTFNNQTRYDLTLDQATANQINLVNAGGSPLNLTWAGTNSNWDVNTTFNWNNAQQKFYQADTVTFDDTGVNTNVTLAASVFPSAVTVSAATNYYFTGTGKLSGGASLTKTGTGLLTMGTANDYAGPTIIAGGILRVGNSSALGTTNGGTTIANGGTLDMNGTSLYNPGESIAIAGTGFTNGGAVINTGAAQNNGIRFLTLSDNAMVRVDNRFDVRGPGGNGSFSGVLDLGGFTFTKMGSAQMSIVDSIVTNAGSMEIAGGVLSLTRSQVDGPGYINLSTNVLLFENSAVGYVNKPFSSSGGTLRVTGNAITLGVVITNLAGLTVDNAVQVTLTNAIIGAGSLTKIGPSQLLLNAPSTYSGATTVSAGNLTLGANGALPDTTGIAVGSGATLDASAVPGGLVLATGQSLSGSGAVIGNVTAGSGASVVPGSSPGTLSLSNNLTLTDASSVFELGSDPTQIGAGANDLVSVGGTLTLSGVTTIKIVPLASLSTSSAYTLFQFNSLVGDLSNLRITSDSRYSFTPSINTSTTPPSIQVTVSGSGASANLVWHGGAASDPNTWDTKTTANWLNGASADVFYLGDNAAFDDSATTGTVTLPAAVQPAVVGITNNSLNYTFSGPGALTAGGLAKDGSAALTIANGANNNFSTPVVLKGGAVSFSGAGANNFNSGLLVQGSTVSFTGPLANSFGPFLAIDAGSVTLNQAADVAITAALSNSTPGTAGSLVKLGANTLTLSGDSGLFDGSIAVSSGTLKTTRGTSLGTSSGGTTIATGATLDVNGQNLGGEPVTAGGTGVNGNGAIVNSGGGQNDALGSVTLTSDTVFGGTGRWDIRNLPAVLSTGSNPYNLVKVGANQVSLVGVTVDSMLANIDVKAGTFDLENTSTAGDPSKTLTVWGGATLEFWNTTVANPLNKVLVLNDTATLWNGSGANAIGAGSPVTLNGAVTFNIAGTSLEVDSSITGSGSLIKTGGNTLILAGNNAYGAGSMISSGTLQLGLGGTTGNLPSQPDGLLVNNGSLVFFRSDDLVFSDKITGTGSLTQNGSGTVVLVASNSFAGSLTIPAYSNGIVRLANSFAAGTAAGNIFVGGNNTGTGRIELSNNITVADPITIECRQAAAFSAPAILNLSGTNTLTGLITGSTGGSEWNFQSDSGKLIVTGNFTNSATSATRHIKLMGAAYGEWSGAISNNAGNGSLTSVVKTNSGSWTLSGLNGYSGPTVIAGGTLVLAPTGSISNSTQIDVLADAAFDVSAVAGFTLASGQTLKGNGALLGSVTAGPNSTVSAGESVGTLTLSGALTFVAGSTNLSEIDKLNATNDLVAAASIAFNGTLVVNEISGTALALGDSFKLFSAASYTGAFAQTNLPALDPSLAWDLSRLAVDGTIRVVAASVIPTTPTNLTFAVSGNKLDISWPASYTGYSLEGQTNTLGVGLSSNWFVVPGSAATNRMVLDIDPSKGTVYYRLHYTAP